jgi:threonylcarbamoyladenosine tRNA methylthiotransferase MtaB
VKYAVITFGCRVNQADSLGFEEQLLASGAEAASPESADTVIVNTCSVTATADQGARQTIRRIARSNPTAKIVVTGCYATRRPDELAALPNVSDVVVNDDKPRLVQILRRVAVQTDGEVRLKADATNEVRLKADATETTERVAGDGPCGATIVPGVAGRTAFTLRVQTGCAEPCSYCIIPTTRGVPRSIAIDDVLRDVARAVAAGFKEIALTGVHLGSYGRDLTPHSSLIGLLRAIDQSPATTSGEGVLFRISSLEPMDCTREIVDLVVGSDHFAPHFHLPVQHASNRILSAMRRPYSVEYYASLVDDIRARIAHASIGTDVIVGFPGETADDFEQLASYLERSPLTHLHVFPYSDRPGTAAAQMGSRVSGAEIRERGRRVRDIGQRLAMKFKDTQVGTTHRALTLEDGRVAVTGNYLKLRIPPGPPRNAWVRVRMTSHHDGELLAG